MVDMSNLMLFVEENLLYDVDKCYDKDYPIPHTENDDKTYEKYLKNVPLISPHSILYQQPSEILFESSLCDDLTELPQENLDNNDNSNELLQKNSRNNPFLNVLIECSNKQEDIQAEIKMPSNNPFSEILEKINQQRKCTNSLSSQLFMQIFKTNQRFQKQILSIFSFLIVKLNSSFVKDKNLPENKLNESYEERLLHASEFLENIILKEDISSLLTTKTNNWSNNIKMLNDFIPEQNNGTSMSLFANNNYVVTGESEINDNNIGFNFKPQVQYIQSTITDQDESAIINSSKEKSAMTELKTKTSAFPCQNDFKDIRTDQFTTFDSIIKDKITSNEFNETNPFKVLLKLKECKNLSAVQVEDDKLDFEKYYSSDYINFNRDNIEMNNNVHDHGSTKQCNDYISSVPNFKYDSFYPEFLSTGNNDPFILLKGGENMTRQFEDRSVGKAKTIRRNSCVKQEYETANTNLGTLLYSENDHFQSSNSYSIPLRDNKTEQNINPGFSFPLNNLLLLDKFKFDRTNAMSNLEIYPNMLNKRGIKELEVSPKELANVSTESVLGDMGKAILSQVNVPNESYVNQSSVESLGILNTNQQFQPTRAYPNYEEIIKNLDSKYTSLSSRQYTNNGERNVNYVIENNIDFGSYNEILPIDALTNEEISVPWYQSLELIRTDKGFTKLYFRTIEVYRKKFCIFHLEDQGWLLVNDFVEEFTNYKTILEFYKELHDNYSIFAFKEIKRSESPSAFFHLDKILSNVPRDKKNKIVSICLMPLISIFMIMHKYINKMVTPFQEDTIIYKALTLIRYYGQLKSFIL